jgi:uncharacterized protein (DUF1919 family)
MSASLMKVPTPLRTLSRYSREAYERLRLGERSIVLVSNNCWGYELYQALRREYSTPFVGLYVYPECYLSLLKAKFPDRLALTGFVASSRYSELTPAYPVGVLADGEELHFLHYRTPEEAQLKWTRRLERMRRALDRSDSVLAVKMCDRDGCEPRHLAAFHELPYRTKLSIGITTSAQRQHIAVPRLLDRDGRSVIDGRSLYRKRYRYFDITEWLIAGSVHHTPASRALGSIS